ncbi:hypothetical protein EYF80_021996 [Liparis tanakae]|uniref:Uncharacterized protein n=1 Tax=Liparis tanakae TaxID=230148 RepID=A0A4Z2HSN1_9TELE|nr:hypothetical protein EYF80_021996 [Liparis tanakae]
MKSNRGPADVGQVVVAGHVVPLAVLVGNGHHTVLASRKEVIWLALPPVLIHLHGSTNSFKHSRRSPLVLCQLAPTCCSPTYRIPHLQKVTTNNRDHASQSSV